MFTKVAVTALALLVGGTCTLGKKDEPTKTVDLLKNQRADVLIEPDQTTAALTAAGYVPFGMAYKEGDDGFAEVYFGPKGATMAQGHGKFMQPWVLRLLKKVPETADDYHDFRNKSVLVQGDDWKGTDEIRPGDVKDASFQCSSDPSQWLNPESITELPGAMATQEPTFDVTKTLHGVHYKCSRR